MKKPVPAKSDAPNPAPPGDLTKRPGNTWADHATTRQGGRHVIDESHLIAPVADLPEPPAVPGPQTSEET